MPCTESPALASARSVIARSHDDDLVSLLDDVNTTDTMPRSPEEAWIAWTRIRLCLADRKRASTRAEWAGVLMTAWGAANHFGYRMATHAAEHGVAHEVFTVLHGECLAAGLADAAAQLQHNVHVSS